MTTCDPEHLYADGGVVGSNPSVVGGTWAWCHVTAGRRVREASGIVTPAEVGVEGVTNNLTELLAVLLGLEALPDGWDGQVWTDSRVTKNRLESKSPLTNVPGGLVERVQVAVRRLGAFRISLVAGHPSNRDLAFGRRADGKVVSRFNVWCDSACAEQARRMREGV